MTSFVEHVGVGVVVPFDMVFAVGTKEEEWSQKFFHDQIFKKECAGHGG